MDNKTKLELESKLKTLRKQLADLYSENPSHCSGIESYMGHSMPPELFEKIENLEEEIKKLEKELNQGGR